MYPSLYKISVFNLVQICCSNVEIWPLQKKAGILLETLTSLIVAIAIPSLIKTCMKTGGCGCNSGPSPGSVFTSLITTCFIQGTLPNYFYKISVIMTLSLGPLPPPLSYLVLKTVADIHVSVVCTDFVQLRVDTSSRPTTKRIVRSSCSASRPGPPPPHQRHIDVNFLKIVWKCPLTHAIPVATRDTFQPICLMYR